jgi:hypothetical protein
MNSWRERLRLIPWPAWVVAVLLYTCISTVVLQFVIPSDPQMNQWQAWQKYLFSFGMPSIVFGYVLLIGFVNGDAKRRGMRYVMWTFLAALVPNALGIILYFLFRDPLPTPCSKCGALAPHSFSFCPLCGTGLVRTCPNCRRAVQAAWANCAYCGTKLGRETQPA